MRFWKRGHAEPGEADDCSTDRRDRAWRCGRQRRGTTQGGSTICQGAESRSLTRRLQHPGSRSFSGKRVEGKHPCKRVVPAEAGDPITRICPLQGPNEAMAYEAPMEAWFTPRECIPERFTGWGSMDSSGWPERGTDCGRAEVRANRDVCCRPTSEDGEDMGLTTLSMEAAEADGRTAQRNRSAAVVRVPRGGSPVVASMPAAA